MNTKLLMISSAFIMGIAGLALSFFPQEISRYFDSKNTSTILLQMIGGLYWGFAMVNWTARANLIGGIYGKPVSIGNFAHFTIGSLTLIKLLFNTPLQPAIAAAGVIYSIFALLFGYVFFTHPGRAS